MFDNKITWKDHNANLEIKRTRSANSSKKLALSEFLHLALLSLNSTAKLPGLVGFWVASVPPYILKSIRKDLFRNQVWDQQLESRHLGIFWYFWFKKWFVYIFKFSTFVLCICIFFVGCKYEILENLERQRLKLTPEWTPSIIRSKSSGLLKKLSWDLRYYYSICWRQWAFYIV